MSERTRDFMVGLVSIGGIVALSILLLLFGELESLINPRYRLTIVTDQSGGIRTGSNVLLNGVPIGMVDDVRLEEGRTDHPVIIIAMINQETRIPNHVVPYASTALLGGASVLELDLDEGEPSDPPGFLPRDGSAVLEFDIKFRLLEEIRAELEARSEPIMEAVDHFEELSRVYTDLGRNFNALLAPQDGDELDAGEPANIRAAIDQAHAMMAEVERTMAEVRKLVGDGELQADVRETIAKANEMIEKASNTIDQIGAVAQNVGEDADAVAASLVPAIDDLSATLQSIRGVATQLTEGEGTAGQLLRNPDLYNALEDASRELEATLTQVQVLIEQLKEEGVDLQF